MSLMSKFFGKRTDEASVAEVKQHETIKNISEDLFVENNPNPDDFIEQGTVIPFNSLEEFKSKDYSVIGYKVGFDEHTMDSLETNIKLIKARFRNIIQHMMDAKRGEIFKLRNELIEAKDISERLEKKLQLRQEELEANVKLLSYELELSIVEEGYVMEALHSFREGFSRGYDDYIEIEHLASKTGMFNLNTNTNA